jgi:hypothetical protein
MDQLASTPFPGCFSQGAMRGLAYAQREAMRRLAKQIEVAHVLYGLLRHMREAASGLRRTSFGERRYLLQVEAVLQHSRGSESTNNQWSCCPSFFLPFSSTSFVGFCAAIAEFQSRQLTYVSEDLLLVGMLKTEDPITFDVLSSLRLSITDLSQLLLPPPGRIDVNEVSTTGQKLLPRQEIASCGADLVAGVIAITPKMMADWLCGYTSGMSDLTRFVPYSKCFDEESIRIFSDAAKLARIRSSNNIDIIDVYLGLLKSFRERPTGLYRLFENHRCLPEWIPRSRSGQCSQRMLFRIGQHWFTHRVEMMLCWAIALAGSIAAPIITVDWLLLALVEVDAVCSSPLFAIPHSVLDDARCLLSSVAHRDPLDFPSMPHDRPPIFFPKQLTNFIYGERSNVKSVLLEFLSILFRFNPFYRNEP